MDLEILSLFFSSHSHIRRYRHPAFVNFFWLYLSLTRFPSNFEDQNFFRVFGMRANLHCGCRCQKHPCTNIAFFLERNTISGRPGKSLACKRYLYPIPWISRLTNISGLVSRFRTRPMRSLLSRGLNVSIEVFYRNSCNNATKGSSAGGMG